MRVASLGDRTGLICRRGTARRCLPVDILLIWNIWPFITIVRKNYSRCAVLMVNCCITVQERYLKTLATDERLPLVAYRVAAKERESHISPYFQIEHSVGRHSGAQIQNLTRTHIIFIFICAC